MAQFLLSAFADEVSPDLEKQIDALKRNGIGYLEPRNISGGILTDAPITSVEQLVAVLKSRDYTLICEGHCAKDGDLHNIHASEF